MTTVKKLWLWNQGNENQNSYFFLLISYWGCTSDKPNWTSEERKLVDVVHIGQPYRAQDRKQMVENRSRGQMEDTVQHPQKDAGTGGISLQGRWGWGVGLKTLIQQILGIAMLDFCFHGAWILGGERDYESAKTQGILNSDKSAGGKWE